MTRIKHPALTPDALLAQVRQMMDAGQRKLSTEDLDALEKLRREAEEDRKEARAWIIAVLGDNPLPVAFYEPWASGGVLRKAEIAGTITGIERKNGKRLITPANFFAWIATLPPDRKRGRPRRAKP